MIFYLLAALVVAVDQVSKAWIRSHVAVGESSSVWLGFVHITRFENTGAAGSSFEGYGQWFVPVAVLLVAFVLYYRFRGKLRGVWMEIGTAFFVGGAIGNAIDRVVFGRVTDFIQFKDRGGIMNLADIALNVGMVAFVLAMLLDGRRRRPAAAAAE